MKTTDHPLVNKYLSFDLSRPNRFGHFGGLVRSVELSAKGELLRVSVQLAGGDKVVTGTTLSARYRGPMLALNRDELESARVVIRGKYFAAWEVT